MKRFSIFLILSVIFLTTSYANETSEEARQLFLEANAAFDSGEFQHAEVIYSSLCQNGWQSWELYYNLANTYYRLDYMAQAILYYERALRLAPNKKIIKDNLALARSKTQDKIDELPRLFLLEWVDAIVNTLTPKGWRSLIIIFMVLMSSALCVFFITKDYRYRKWSFIIGSFILFFLIISAVNATISVRNVTDKSKAIVVQPLLVVKGAPDAKSVDKFVLHEGTKLTITDQQDQWWQVEIADGKSGWITGGAEII